MYFVGPDSKRLRPPVIKATNHGESAKKILCYSSLVQDSGQITKLLQDWNDGDRQAFDQLIPLVYAELRRQASRFLRNERPGHTLQTTALIHEAYLKLVGNDQMHWQNRKHFFAIAATSMRRILVDHARERSREKRGGGRENLPLDEALQASESGKSVDLVALDAALNRLEKLSPRQARVVELRYFAGLSIDETAEALEVSRATVRNDWNIARAWLKQEIES